MSNLRGMEDRREIGWWDPCLVSDVNLLDLTIQEKFCHSFDLGSLLDDFFSQIYQILALRMR